MPNCFQLTRKGETEPMSLAKIDDLLCEYMGVASDPVHYYLGWYNTIGFALALGQTFQQIRNRIVEYYFDHPDSEAEAEELKVLDWFADNFTPDAWAERR